MEENRLTFKEVFDWARANIKESKRYSMEEELGYIVDIVIDDYEIIEHSKSIIKKDYSIVIHNKTAYGIYITPILRIVNYENFDDHVNADACMLGIKLRTTTFIDVYTMGSSLYFYYNYEEYLPNIEINDDDINNILLKIMNSKEE